MGPWRLNLLAEPDWCLSHHGRKSKEGPQDRDHFLHRDPSHAGTGLGQEGFQFGDLDVRQSANLLVISKEPQKVAGNDAMTCNRRVGKSTQLL
jgi:hypothetical protein